MTDRKGRGCSDAQRSEWLSGLGLSSFVSVNLVTSGLSPNSDNIVEIGAVRFVDGQITGSFQSLIKPEDPVGHDLAEETGILEDDLNSAPSFLQIAPDIVNFVGDSILVAHHADFALSFLGRSRLTPSSSDSLSRSSFGQTGVVDTLLIGRTFWPELTSFSLQSLAAHFGMQVSGVVRALDNATLVGELLLQMITDLPSRVWADLARDLHRLIGSTTHRSRFFFAALVECARNSEMRDVGRLPDETDEDRCESVTESLGTLLGPGGYFESKLDFFESRPAQIEMASAVGRALNRDEILLLEAPTGVGKSLGYLLPAVVWALANPDEQRRVLVSSHTKTLQEQLHQKDVNEVRRGIGMPFRTAVLKGRSNYLCKRRLNSVLTDPKSRLSELDRISLMPLLRWSAVTRTGDVSEIGAFNPKTHSFLWSQVCSDAHACSGSSCSSAKGDFHRLAQERASRAHVVFVNHALLLSDLPRMMAGDKQSRRLIVDEAHQLEKSAVSAMTVEISSPLLRSVLWAIQDEQAGRGILRSILRREISMSDEIEELTVWLADKVSALYAGVRHSLSGLGQSLMALSSDRGRPVKVRFRQGDIWHREILSSLDPFRLQWMEFSSHLEELVMLLGDLRGDRRPPSEVMGELRSAADSIRRVSEDLTRVMHDPDADFVTWVEFGLSGQTPWCSISLAPVTVAKALHSALWEMTEGTVLTSATLSASGDFSLLKDSLGLSENRERDVRELCLTSAYDSEKQMRLFVPIFLTDPRFNDLDFIDGLGSIVRAVTSEFQKSTLILCTSLDTVERLTASVRPLMIRSGRPLFSQVRTSSAAEMLAEFRKSQDGVLVGAATFWEGIDLVGEALEILVVSKIPFDVPVDPWVAARSERIVEEGGDPFRDFALPSAILRLKQGIGRLLRHPEDRGVVILADPRVFTSPYGSVIRRALPGTARAIGSLNELRDGMAEFFGEKAA